MGSFVYAGVKIELASFTSSQAQWLMLDIGYPTLIVRHHVGLTLFSSMWNMLKKEGQPLPEIQEIWLAREGIYPVRIPGSRHDARDIILTLQSSEWEPYGPYNKYLHKALWAAASQGVTRIAIDHATAACAYAADSVRDFLDAGQHSFTEICFPHNDSDNVRRLFGTKP